MFGSDCRGCYSARNYEEAKDRYHKTPQPRGATWGPNERPLDNNRKHHYRIVQGEGEAHYDIMLYNTVMARYHRPTPDGWRVQYNYYSRMTTHAFMWQVLDLRYHPYGVLRLRTTRSQTVMVPIGTGSRFDDLYGADLWFKDTGVIDVSRSDHEPVEIPKYTDEFKAWRAELRETFAPLMNLFAFCAEEVRQGWVPHNDWRTHPGSLRGLSDLEPDLVALTRYLTTHRDAGSLLQDAKFIDLAREAYKTNVIRSLDVRDYRELPTPTTDALAKAATRALMEQLEELWGVRSKRRWEPLPKFVEHLPKNFRRT
jgi:hypothetical protein